MISTESLTSAIDFLQRLRGGAVGISVDALRHPGKYLPGVDWPAVLAERARTVLDGLARTPAEQALAGQLVASITVNIAAPENGVTFGLATALDIMARAQAISQSLFTRAYANVQRTRQQPMSPGADQQTQLDSVFEAIRDWVEKEKRKDERDAPVGYDSDAIAHRLMFVLGFYQRDSLYFDRESQSMEGAGPQESRRYWLKSTKADPSEQVTQQLARRDALFGVIQDYVNRHPELAAAESTGSGPGIAPATLHNWLQQILASWRSMVLAEVPHLIRAALAKLGKKEQGELKV